MSTSVKQWVGCQGTHWIAIWSLFALPDSVRPPLVGCGWQCLCSHVLVRALACVPTLILMRFVSFVATGLRRGVLQSLQSRLTDGSALGELSSVVDRPSLSFTGLMSCAWPRLCCHQPAWHPLGTCVRLRVLFAHFTGNAERQN